MGKCFSKSKSANRKEELGLRQFDLLRSVGRGAFGKVRIVKKKRDKTLYALKYINKEKCITQKALRNTIFERDLLENLEHPLIVNLRYAFQDDENMFMVLDLMLGGDLKFHQKQTGTFPEEVVRFYAAEITCALEYLHQRGIVHRDIKPDNLLLDADGHVHLTDFNVAALLPQDGSFLRSFSGTLTYMAPEVVQRANYREEVDWWSLGIVSYELLYGKRPFRGRTSRELARRIVKGPLQFPSSKELSDECYDFITKLLCKKPTERLGHGGADEVKRHPFFSRIDWNKIQSKELPPLFVPDSKRANFSAIFEAEDVLMEDRPLRERKKKSVHRDHPLSKDEQYIEDNFRDFDFKKRNAEEQALQAQQQEELVHKSMARERERMLMADQCDVERPEGEPSISNVSEDCQATDSDSSGL